jgi:Zn-dependent protease with chaperone function
MNHFPRLLLLSILLLLVTGPSFVCFADDREERIKRWRDTAALGILVDKQGEVEITFSLPRKIDDPQPLKRRLTEAFSVPLQFREIPEADYEEGEEEEIANEIDTNFASTTLLATLARSSEEIGNRSECKIDLEPLLVELRSHNVGNLGFSLLVLDAPDNLVVKGAEKLRATPGHISYHRSEIDVRAPAVNVIEFSMAYARADVLKSTIPLVAFLILPAIWTFAMTHTGRRLRDRPAELWGRHLRFLHRLLNTVWIIWLPVYSLSGMGEVISHFLGRTHEEYAQVLNVALYFVPPILTLMLCHLASTRIYRQIPDERWSARAVVHAAIAASAFSLAPLFLIVLAINIFRTDPSRAVLFGIIGYVGWLILQKGFRRVFTVEGHSITTGDFRDRVLDLASEAGVFLKQVYVVPDGRAQLANAFATSEDTVAISNSLLKNLSCREVDVIMAHEIGHVQARHPHMRNTITIVVMIAMNVLGSMVAVSVGLHNLTPFVFSAALALSSLILFFVSRRNERQADEISIKLTNDPEAFISGLAKISRMNLLPLHSGRWAESLDTHPATMRRFENIAKSHGISTDRLQALLSEQNPPDVTYPPVEEEVFTEQAAATEFKNKYRVRVALLILAAVILAPLPFAALLSFDLPIINSLCVSLIGLVCSFVMVQVVRNRICFLGYASLSRKIKALLVKRGHEELVQHGVLVGLAPVAESSQFEKYPFWDVGVLALTDEKLVYVGEQTEFSLLREQVHDCYTENALPQWLSEKNLFLEWQTDPEASKEKLHFVAVGERSVVDARRAIGSLRKRVQSWHKGVERFPAFPTALESVAGPNFPEVTKTQLVTSFQLSSAVAAGIHFACYAALVSFALRFSWVGIIYAATVAFATIIIDELPKAFKAKTTQSDQVKAHPQITQIKSV